MTGIPFEALEDADLVVGATYQGGRAGNAGDDPISKLFRVGKHGIGNQGGFRRSGSWEHPNLVVLYTSKEDPDWPDSIDHTTGRLTYYGDNKTPGKDLLDTPRQGNRLLKAVFSELHAGSRVVPPFFVFEKAGSGRDVVFRGLAAPGGQGLRPGEDLAIDRRWDPGSRFENYLATFTILHVPSIGRRWLGELYAGEDLAEHCPRAWRRWRQEGSYEPLGLEGKSVARVQTRSSSGFELSEEQDREARRLSVDSPEAQEIDSYLRFLKERSFGGKKQAVAPGMERLAIELEAPAMPGADEAADWISSRFGQESARPAFLFLVGGSGNGKSHISARIVEPLEELGEHDSEVDQRLYRYATTGPDLLLVNDATIGQGTRLAGATLVKDLDQALQDRYHAVVNVNRGVLVKELLLDPQPGLGLTIVKWLAGTDPPPNDDLVVDSNISSTSQFIRVARVVREGEYLVDLVAVFMDKASLMECRPESDVADRDGEVEVVLGNYGVQRFTERTEEFSEDTPAARLLRSVVEQQPDSRLLLEVDPICANLESLGHSKVRTGLLSVLRGSEIVKSTRLTYRDLWHLLGQAVMGFLCEQPENYSPMAWLIDNQPARFQDPRERLEAVLRLAQLRVHQAIYMGDCCPIAQVDSKVQSEAIKTVQGVDPVKDFLPGLRSPTPPWSKFDYGWAAPISEAFAGIEFGWSPLAGLRAAIPDPNDAAISAITDFDEVLDGCIVEALEAQRDEYPSDGEKRVVLSDGEKRDLIRWYGCYLERLYATAHGIPAFRGQVDWWTHAWKFAKGNPGGDGPYKDEVRTLLFPEYSTQPGHLLLPAFDSRVVPVTGEVDEPILVKAFQAGHAETEWLVDGDSILLHMLQGDDALIELDFDFAVVREMFACRSGRLGLTENSHNAEPLLERFRAAMLRPQMRPIPELWVVRRGDRQLLGVEGQGT